MMNALLSDHRSQDGRDGATERQVDGACNGQHATALHRVATVRKQQGVTLRTAARRWNVDIAQVRELENETTDLTLSQLYAWQELLNVPIEELLCDCDRPLSSPILRRAQLVRLMKTAATLEKYSVNPPVQRLLEMLREQLVEMMPELEHIGPWQGSDPDASGRNYQPMTYGMPTEWLSTG
jgi:transcriptional regulator with XRE-family HTH domain